jgi:hypothetical protein
MSEADEQVAFNCWHQPNGTRDIDITGAPKLIQPHRHLSHKRATPLPRPSPA